MIFKQAKRSLYPDSEGELALTSEGLIPFFGILNGHEKSCDWEIFDGPVAPTGAIKENLDHYGEISLSNIKAHTVTINAVNEWQEK